MEVVYGSPYRCLTITYENALHHFDYTYYCVNSACLHVQLLQTEPAYMDNRMVVWQRVMKKCLQTKTGASLSEWGFFTIFTLCVCVCMCVCAVSYTHLDVYKRQVQLDWCLHWIYILCIFMLTSYMSLSCSTTLANILPITFKLFWNFVHTTLHCLSLIHI